LLSVTQKADAQWSAETVNVRSKGHCGNARALAILEAWRVQDRSCSNALVGVQLLIALLRPAAT
jgi:hypothetical protein